MNMQSIFLSGLAALTLAGTPLRATDFGPLMEVVRTTWPQKTRLAVVADYANSRAEIFALAQAAGSGTTLTVLDTRHGDQANVAATLLVHRVKPDYVVLLPRDRAVWDGSVPATILVRKVAEAGIPSIATTPRSLQNGALFAMGEATGLETLVTEKMIGTVEVTLPRKGTYLNTTAKLDLGLAKIVVLTASKR